MPSRSPVFGRHLFVSPSGAALSRWMQAFPKAMVSRAVGLNRRSAEVKNALVVWLHLDPASAPVDQLLALKTRVGSVRIIVLANSPDDEEALALFSAGARGYCNAHATSANLKKVASVVMDGGLWIGEKLMQRLVVATQGALSAPRAGRAAVVPSQGAGRELHSLTAREREVAQSVARGSSNKEVARSLGITDRTVKAHVSAIFQKLGARDRLHLALIVNGHVTS